MVRVVVMQIHFLLKYALHVYAPAPTPAPARARALALAPLSGNFRAPGVVGRF